MDVLAALSRSELSQILVQLVLNAIEASEQGAKIRVTIALNEVGLTIAVEDDGHGLDTETAEKIFDAFFTTRLERNASGLGLTIVRRIVSNAGGKVELVKRQNPTQFLVHLRCASIEDSRA